METSYTIRHFDRSSTVALMAFTLIALVVLAGCSSSQQVAGQAIASQGAPAAEPMPKASAQQALSPIKLGVSLPLTGEAASLGVSVKEGIDLALSEINGAGGIDGRKIDVIYEDDKCSKDGITTLTKLVTVDNVDAVAGPLCSAAGGPGLPVVQQAGTPAVIMASAPHLTKIGDFIFRVYPSDAFAGKFMAGYVFDKLRLKKAAIIYVKNDWGQGIRDTFSQAFKELGGQVVFDEGIAQDEKDLRTVVSKLQAASPDVIIAPLYPAGALDFVKQGKELGVSAPIIGGDAMDADEVVKSGIMDGVIYTVARVENPPAFKAKLAAAGKGSTMVWSGQGYDIVKLYAQVWDEVGTDKKAVRDALARVTYKGISVPTVQFDENGDLKQTLYDVKLIKDKKSEVIG